jgi:hypothetical protein
MLWEKRNGLLHLVVDVVSLCKTSEDLGNGICRTCLEIYAIAKVQLEALCVKEQVQPMKLDNKFFSEPTSVVKDAQKLDSLLGLQSIIVNLEEWVGRKNKKSTTQQISSSFVELEQLDAMVGLNQIAK